jgi:hypothetical protein
MSEVHERGRMRIALVVLVGLMVLIAAASTAAPAQADHCDEAHDSNCGPHIPDGPGPVKPPCNGSVGPLHAWPCAVDQSIDCSQAATSPESCDAVQVTVQPTTAGPVTVNGASTAPVTLPVPNAYNPVGHYVQPVICEIREKDPNACVIRP